MLKNKKVNYYEGGRGVYIFFQFTAVVSSNGMRRGLILEIRKFLTQQVYRLQEVHHKQHLKLQWCASGKFAKLVR